jgi:hypothetical protein
MMGVIEFGRQLLETQDLDPVYVMLHHSGFPQAQKERWCVAYWLFYHAGVSSQISEQKNGSFWKGCKAALVGPRGTERRHFRGSAAAATVDWFQSRRPAPEDFVEYLCPTGSQETFHSVTSRALQVPQFGPWIAFKVCDMLERVLGREVDSSDCDLLFFKDPLEGARRAAAHLGLAAPGDAVQYLLKAFGGKAPPDFGRRINLQEVETVLCKWKSHLNGRYEVGKDSIEVAHALHKFPCASSRRLLQCLEENVTCHPRAALC